MRRIGVVTMTVLFGFVLLGASLVHAQYPLNKKQQSQERRIEQGVANGELTPREAEYLEKEQREIEKAKRAALRDGVLDWRERKHLEHLQDKADADIYRLKHNDWRDENDWRFRHDHGGVDYYRR